MDLVVCEYISLPTNSLYTNQPTDLPTAGNLPQLPTPSRTMTSPTIRARMIETTTTAAMSGQRHEGYQPAVLYTYSVQSSWKVGGGG